MTENTILTLTAGRTEIEVWTLGARLNAATWDGEANLLDGAATEEEARTTKLNHGSVCGPVANRIAGGAAMIDGQTYPFERNENGKTLLHSGTKSTRDAQWSVTDQSETRATLTLDIAHLEDDFPGNRTITATYSVTDQGFDLTFTATSDATTCMNLALHPYWTLGTDRDGLRLQVNAGTYLPVDADTIPTGEQADVTGTDFDLRSLAAPSPKIDHNYCFPNDGQMRAHAILASDRLRLDLDSTAPGLQVFTGKPFGIALEPQHWPDAPHHDTFPSILLRPGETYTQATRYRFSRPG